MGTLFMGGVDWSISEDLVRNKLKDYGSILSVTLLPDRKCGFVTFATREEAEGTMTALFDLFYLNKRKLELNWARSKGGNNTNTNSNNTNTNSAESEQKQQIGPQKRTEQEITADEQAFLETQGIVPPKLPPM